VGNRGDWANNRDNNWNQRVTNRQNNWNQWQQNNQQRLNNFQANQSQRWNNLQNAQANRQNWRDQNREDWQQHREEMWDYRADRANEIWDNAENFYDNYFDDHWWGENWGYGYGWGGQYASNPWWWWAPAAFNTAASFIHGVASEPAYVDYGMNVVYEGETTYVNNNPVPTAQYTQPMVNLAVNVEQPPPPLPPEPGQKAQWMPLGVFALAQQEKGDPIMFMQLSVNQDGLISGAYSSTLTDDNRTVAGQVDPKTQQAAWRIGENMNTIFMTSLANLTLDVSPVQIDFGGGRIQTWLLVRMPEPPPADGTGKIPEVNRTPPPLKKT
jgi:hypothetical protein